MSTIGYWQERVEDAETTAARLQDERDIARDDLSAMRKLVLERMGEVEQSLRTLAMVVQMAVADRDLQVQSTQLIVLTLARIAQTGQEVQP